MTTLPLIRKAGPGETKVLDAAKGIVEAYVNTMGVIDFDGEVLAPGAFADSLARLPAVAWMHDQTTIVGGVTNAAQERGADGTARLRATMQFDLDTEPGAYAFKMVERGRVTEWSVGFYALAQHDEQRDGRSVRVIDAVDWAEVSPVLRGASPGTTTVGVKDRPPGTTPDEKDEKAVWSAAYVNDLPDSAFAAIEAGGQKDDTGKTTPRSLRHFPHHDSGGDPDAPHVRNGLARVPQSSLSSDLRARAERHLRGHAADMGIGAQSGPPPATAAATPPEHDAGDAAATDRDRAAALLELTALELALGGIDVADLDLTLSQPAAPVPAETDTKAGRRNSAADMKRLQAIHDMACEMGAQCSDMQE